MVSHNATLGSVPLFLIAACGLQAQIEASEDLFTKTLQQCRVFGAWPWTVVLFLFNGFPAGWEGCPDSRSLDQQLHSYSDCFSRPKAYGDRLKTSPVILSSKRR